MLDYTDLLQDEQFSKEDINNAALIIHPSWKWYNLKAEEINYVFEEWSNFTHLKNPIYDDFGNEFRDSEWYYMASRTDNPEIKKMIAFMSIWYGLARKSRELFDLDTDERKRIEYMHKAINLKFDSNPLLKEKLLNTGNKNIIEYTYWKDTFFWIDQNTLTGRNILGKLLVAYRDNNR